MWILLLIAVNVNNANDIPGKVELTFQDQETCQQTLSTVRYWLKLKTFKIIAQCEKKY